MAIKTTDGRYFAGLMVIKGVRELGTELTDIRPSDIRLDCKYCDTDEAPTVESHEYILGHNRQLLCALCGAGLTPTEPVDE
jgi:hypothetical protein